MDNQTNLKNILQKFLKELPKFSDGRIDYSNSNKALVLTCFVKYKDEILLLKRSNKVRVYQGLWNVVAGYIDELCPVEHKAFTELEEELGITKNIVKQIKHSKPYKFYDQGTHKTWIVFPLLAILKEKPVIQLDWEHIEYKWIKPDEISKYKTVPKLNISLKKYYN